MKAASQQQQQQPGHHEEVLSLTGVASPSSHTQSAPPAASGTRCGGSCSKVTAALAIALAVAVAALVVTLGVQQQQRQADGHNCLAPACMHHLGGGPVKPGGSLDSSVHAQCAQQLRAYADSHSGAYWKDVQLAMDSAMQVFGFSHAAPLGQPTATWHDAPTSVSRRRLQQQQQQQQQPPGPLLVGGPVLAPADSRHMQQQQQQQQPPQPSRDQLVVFDIDETVLSNMPQILDPATWPWDAWVAAARAEPLRPTLAFYRALCGAGFSVGFVTGRREASRNATAANLESAGFGTPCRPGPGPFHGLRPTASPGAGDACCWSALYLRAAGDTRLASTYKPWARRQLLAAAGPAARIVALVGDQFSDLNGEEAAPLAFKLPNPFYAIL